MFSFVRNLVGVKTDQAVNGAVAALVRWDPHSATEAELRTMEQHLDELGRRVAEARMAFDRERGEADAITQLSRPAHGGGGAAARSARRPKPIRPARRKWSAAWPRWWGCWSR